MNPRDAKTQPDSILMGYVATGSLWAVEPLIERHGDRVYRIVRRISFRKQDADDLFQEVWIKVVDKARAYDPNRPFGPWLAKIAVNTSIDWQRRNEQSLDHLDDRVVELTESGASAEHALMTSEQHRRSAMALARLPEPLRAVLLLRFFEELGEKDMAIELGVPAGTVKSRIHTALATLRVALEELT